jgi:hypothetical protein
MTKPIEWDKLIRVRLVVDVTGKSGLPDATVEDLRDACGAAGLRDEVTLAKSLAEAHKRIAELEQTLDYVARGITLDEAGPIVYQIAQRTEQEAKELATRECLLVRAMKADVGLELCHSIGGTQSTVRFKSIIGDHIERVTGENIREVVGKTLDRVERVTQRANEVRGALEGEMREKYRSGS